MKKLFKYFICLTIIFMLCGCGKESNKIVMVTESGFAPYEYRSGDEVVGVDVDIAREIAKELKKELVIKDVDFGSIINELNSGKADFAAAGMSIDEERKKSVDFSIEYATSEQVVVVRKGYDKIKSMNDLENKTISVQLGTVADTYLTDKFSNVKLFRQKKFLAAAEDVKTGKSDCIVMDKLPAIELVKSNPELEILNVTLFTDKYAIAVKKGNTELLNKINSVLERLMKEGKLEVMSELLNGIYDDFYKTVIFDERYKLILEGLKNTILIAIGALIVGILLGSIISIVKYTNKERGKFKLLSKIFDIYVNIIRGTPSVLQLMIMYYVIFKTSTIDSVIVGIIAFGINSSAYVAEILRSGFDSIDDGQVEAGLSLGLNFRQVLKYIIIPQAIKVSLPSMGNEFVTLIKETAIAGYIGIEDLTKASDIIASRTYDYFFPLVLVALIYLVLTSVISKLLKKMERKLNVND